MRDITQNVIETATNVIVDKEREIMKNLYYSRQFDFQTTPFTLEYKQMLQEVRSLTAQGKATQVEFFDGFKFVDLSKDQRFLTHVMENRIREVDFYAKEKRLVISYVQ